MNLLFIVPHYVSWHYTTGIRGCLELFKTFLWFLWHFFSIVLLFQTLFAPFQRLKETAKGKGLDIEGFFAALITTMLMRLIGFLFRSMVIVFGIAVLVAFIALSIVGFIAWLLLPFLLIAIVILGFKALFTFGNPSV